MKTNEIEGDTLIISGYLSRSNDRASGYDLCAQFESYIPPGQSRLISTGVTIKNLPNHMYGYVVGSPDLMTHHGLISTPLVVDADYLGEIRIGLHNPGKVTFQVNEGQRVATIVFSFSVHPHFVYDDSEMIFKMPKRLSVDNRIAEKHKAVLYEWG